MSNLRIVLPPPPPRLPRNHFAMRPQVTRTQRIVRLIVLQIVVAAVILLVIHIKL